MGGAETTFLGLLITFWFSFSLSRSFIFSETILRPSLLLANKPGVLLPDCGIDGLLVAPSFADRSRVTLGPGAAERESGLEVEGVGGLGGGILPG